MEFLVRGATEFHEPGVCLSFEETAEELTSNVASLGFDLDALVAQCKLAIDHIFLERSLIEDAGEYDLEALFVRLGLSGFLQKPYTAARIAEKIKATLAASDL